MLIVALWHALRRLPSRDSGMFLAAGLSFFFLVCLVPMLFLFVSVVGFVLRSEAATSAVLNQLSADRPRLQEASSTDALVRA